MNDSTIVITNVDQTTVEITDKFGTNVIEKSIETITLYSGAKGEKGDKGDAGEPGPASRWRGAYDNATQYLVGDSVSYDGSSYIAIAETIGNLPTNSTFWDVTSAKGDTALDGLIVSMDFGLNGFETYAEETIIGQSWVKNTSKIVVCLYAEDDGERSFEDSAIEGIVVSVGRIVEGIGFTISAYAPQGAIGVYKVQVMGG